jgi:hypothetical protein
MAEEIIQTGVPVFDKLEVVKTGTIAVSKGSGSTQDSTTINHNLGYTPVFMAFLISGGFYFNLPLILFGTVTHGRQVWDAYVDDTTITARVTVENTGATLSSDIRYYLFRVTAKPN